MTGDAAGAITPLTGNGMAMGIHSGKICSELVDQFLSGKIKRAEMNDRYKKSWKQEFGKRLWLGNKFQRLFGRNLVSEMSFKVLKLYPSLLPYLISKTHGDRI